MMIKIIEDEKKARDFSEKIYEVINSGYGEAKDDLCRIGRIITSSGCVTLDDMRGLQEALTFSKEFTEQIEKLVQEVYGYAV